MVTPLLTSDKSSSVSHNTFFSNIDFVCMCVCTCLHMNGCMPGRSFLCYCVNMWRSEDTFLGASFSSSIMWILRSKLDFSGLALAASAFTCCAILPPRVPHLTLIRAALMRTVPIPLWVSGSPLLDCYLVPFPCIADPAQSTISFQPRRRLTVRKNAWCPMSLSQ